MEPTPIRGLCCQFSLEAVRGRVCLSRVALAERVLRCFSVYIYIPIYTIYLNIIIEREREGCQDVEASEQSDGGI